MTEIIGVKFKNRGKTYWFSPRGLTVHAGDKVIVEMAKGVEMAECVMGNHMVEDELVTPPLRNTVRLATEKDLRIAQLNREKEKEAFKICQDQIRLHNLDMKLVDVECGFDGNKIMFFFTSEDRVDFRSLVRDLAGVFRTRIELRQIGVRDEAKVLGGLGMCGRPYCCHQFLDDFLPVSTKMAKTQSLSLNPTKISGACGRLMCCLRYEQEAYEELVRTLPKIGAFVETPVGYGAVTQVNVLRQKVKVKIDDDSGLPRTYDLDEIAVVPGGRPRPGEPLPHVLKLKPGSGEEKKRDEGEYSRNAVKISGGHTETAKKENAASKRDGKKNFRRSAAGSQSGRHSAEKEARQSRDHRERGDIKEKKDGKKSDTRPKRKKHPGGEAGARLRESREQLDMEVAPNVEIPQAVEAKISAEKKKKPNYRRKSYNRKPKSGEQKG